MKPIINGTVIVNSTEAADTLSRAITRVAVNEITYQRIDGFTTVHVTDLSFDREADLRVALAEIAPSTVYGTLSIYSNGALYGYQYADGKWYEGFWDINFCEIESLEAL